MTHEGEKGIRDRGDRDFFFLIRDGFNGLLGVAGNAWPLTPVQTCVIHFIRDSLQFASK